MRATYLRQLSDVKISEPTQGQTIVYDRATKKWVNRALDPSAPHTHDDRYYTETEVDDFLEDKLDKASNDPFEGAILSFAGDSTIWKSFSDAGIPRVYRTEFDSSDLVSGKLTVTHSLGVATVNLSLFDSSTYQLMTVANEVKILDDDSIEVDLQGFTVSGTWEVVVIG